LWAHSSALWFPVLILALAGAWSWLEVFTRFHDKLVVEQVTCQQFEFQRARARHTSPCENPRVLGLEHVRDLAA
jgi:hypothetical protein